MNLALDPHLSIHHVHLYVGDLDRSLHFFTQLLGLRLIFDYEAETVGRFIAVAPRDGTAILGLLTPRPGTPEHDLIGRSGHTVFVTDDIQAKYEEWIKRGVIFRSGPAETDWGGVFATLTDPDGNSFALMSHNELSRRLEDERRALADRAEEERRSLREMAIAREFQARLLPQELPALHSVDFAGRCIQARQIGGDYFDCLSLGGDAVGFVIGDISGKGIAAALVMANLQAVVRSQLALAVEDPPRFMQSVNGHLFDNTVPNAYATMFFGVYNEGSGRFRYVNCGHPPALLLRANGTVELLGATTTVVGLFAVSECPAAVTQLSPGDTLLLYTDGVTECFDPNGVEFGMERLMALLQGTRERSAAEILEEIVTAVSEFGGPEQQDDVTLIVARCRPA
ncbi:PP2C family protein-serine/threonine phosphatase [Paludibaculum fermentans]|uniref:PP2C family protein-serine/threonine phosphatase n=1 Tax=Paludibaculum fermentans TaxID=1473598 RepID=UPI003EBEB311